MILFADRFQEFPIGDLPFDYTAVGEYHFLDLPPCPGGWVDATNDTSWRQLGNWQVVQEGGRRVMQQARLRTQGLPILAAGDGRWRDVAVEAEVRLLSAKTEAGLMVRYANNRTHYSLCLRGDGRVRLVRRKHQDRTVLGEGIWEPEFTRYHTLRLQLDRDHLTAWLDGQLLYEVRDGALSSGKIGLRAGGPKPRSRGCDRRKRRRSASRRNGRRRAGVGTKQGSARSGAVAGSTSYFGTGHTSARRSRGDGRLEIVLASTRRCWAAAFLYAGLPHRDEP
jgi:hypothetical protein